MSNPKLGFPPKVKYGATELLIGWKVGGIGRTTLWCLHNALSDGIPVDDFGNVHIFRIHMIFIGS